MQRATREFTVAGKTYPAGSYIVRSAQAFRPHVLDMFEPQDHPNDFSYPGGPPIPPYDNAGWTLAYQMGVRFDRVLDAFDGPFEPIPGFAHVAGVISAAPASGGVYSWSGAENDAFIGANRLLKAGERVERDASGDFYAPAHSATRAILGAFAAEKGVNVTTAPAMPASATAVRPVRIALWDVYGGSMASGWTRFVLDQFEFPYEVVYAPQLDAGDLKSKYDVIFLPSGEVIGRTGAGARGSTAARGEAPLPDDIPAEFRAHYGRMTVEKTLPAIRQFLDAGGVVLANGSATSIAEQLGLPVAEAPTDSAGRPLSRDKYYIPGSVLSIRIDTSFSVARGMQPRADIIFDNSPAFRLLPGAAAAGVERIAWFDSPKPLRSGWAWGQAYLDNAAAIVQAHVGNGKLVLYGPEMNFRSQSHGAFKLLFNALYPAPGK